MRPAETNVPRPRAGPPRQPGTRSTKKAFAWDVAPDSNVGHIQIGIDQGPLPDPACLWHIREITLSLGDIWELSVPPKEDLQSRESPDHAQLDARPVLKRNVMARPSSTVIDRQFFDSMQPQRSMPVSLLCCTRPHDLCDGWRRETWRTGGRQGIEICQPTNEDDEKGKFAVAEPRTSRRGAVGRQVAPKRIQYSDCQSVQWSFCCRRIFSSR